MVRPKEVSRMNNKALMTDLLLSNTCEYMRPKERVFR